MTFYHFMFAIIIIIIIIWNISYVQHGYVKLFNITQGSHTLYMFSNSGIIHLKFINYRHTASVFLAQIAY